jgi:hypothetical protein
MDNLTRLSVFCFLIIFQAQSSAQVPNWEWAKSHSGNGDNSGYQISTDAAGNVFVTGIFNSPTIAFGTTTLNSAGKGDIFVAKYNASGNVLWAKSAGGTADDWGFGIATDLAGNVFVTGYFNSLSCVVGTTTLTNANTVATSDIFIVKYDASGNVLWAKSAGTPYNEIGFGISTDAAGNAFVTGEFTGQTLACGTTTLTNAGPVYTSDIFVVKYSGTGNVLWAKSEGGVDNDIGHAIVTTATGDVLVTGKYKSPTLTPGTTTLTNAGSATNDAFVIKYDASGNVVWAKSIGAPSDETGYDISSDVSGNVFVAGEFYSNTFVSGTTTLTNTGIVNTADIFLIKYDVSGNVLWTKSAGGISDDSGVGISTDGNGNSYMLGLFYSTNIAFGSTALTNAGPNTSSDILVAKYDASGIVQWAKSAGGINDDLGIGIAANTEGNVYVTGFFLSPSIAFGATTLTATGPANSTAVFVSGLGALKVGLEEFSAGSNHTLFPNPFSTQAVIRSNIPLSNAVLTAYNGSGQIVKKVCDLRGEKVNLFRDNLSAGLYFYNLTQDGTTLSTGKFVISDD